METRNNRVLKIATAVFALTMFATYIVYSQRQRTRGYVAASSATGTNHIVRYTSGTNHAPAQKAAMVAPGSKVRAPLVDLRTVDPKPARQAASQQPVVASSSKSMSPVIAVRPVTITQSQHDFFTVAASSKSGKVFDARALEQLTQPTMPSTAQRTHVISNKLVSPSPQVLHYPNDPTR